MRNIFKGVGVGIIPVDRVQSRRSLERSRVYGVVGGRRRVGQLLTSL